jgi:hypothetical protein
VETFSTAQVGALFRLGPRALNKWIKKGFPPPQRVGRFLRWTATDIERVRMVCEARRVPLGTLSTGQVEERLGLKPRALNALIGRGAPAPAARLMDTGKPRVWTQADVDRIRAFTSKHANSAWKRARRRAAKQAKQARNVFSRVDVAAARKEAKGMLRMIGFNGETPQTLLAAIAVSERDEELMRVGSETGFVDGRSIEGIVLFRKCVAEEFRKLVAAEGEPNGIDRRPDAGPGGESPRRARNRLAGSSRRLVVMRHHRTAGARTIAGCPDAEDRRSVSALAGSV